MGEESNVFQETFPTLSVDEKRRARRYSTGSTASRYIGPSPGSCHDFCKYGNKKETWPDIRSVMSYGRMTTKLSGGPGSEGEIPSIGIIKDKPKANKMNLAAGTRKKASFFQQPKSRMQSYPASSAGALKPKSTRTAPIVPSKSQALPPKIKPIMTIRTKKSMGPSINSATPPKAQKKNKAAHSGGDNKEDVQREELYFDVVKVENEASVSTDSPSTPCFSNIQENGSSCKFSDFTEADEADATEVEIEDEAQMNRSVEDAYREGNLNLQREKVNGIRSLIPSTRRLKFRSHPDNNEWEDSGYLSDPGSMKVALRHWQLQEKKAARRSLNDIIEETAVKLGSTQRSKVKALVGAFETIISLQEVGPSANIGKWDLTSQPQTTMAIEVGRDQSIQTEQRGKLQLSSLH